MANQPLWYKLIGQSRKKDIIIDGLTIPFILGAQKFLDPAFIIDDNSIFNLLSSIAGSDADEKAVLKDCSGNQYIITLRDSRFCKENLSGALAFKNKKGKPSLYVAGNIVFLGKTLKEISQSLNNEYKGLFKKETFSWQDNKMSWHTLNDIEKEIIRESAK